MNQSEASWKRCAKEFSDTDPRSFMIVKLPLKLKESDDPLTRSVQVKKLDFKNRGVVATDAALANLDHIETSELVAKWIADGICTPPTSTSGNCPEVDDDHENTQTKSPRIKLVPSRKNRVVNRTLPGVTKSPIFKKRKRDVVRNSREDFGLWDTLMLNKSAGLIDRDKSLKLGNGSSEVRRKHRPIILRRRLQDDLKPKNNSFASSSFKQNEKEISSKSLDAGIEAKKLQESTRIPETKEEMILDRFDTVGLSQDLFDDELIITTPKVARIYSPEKKSDADKEAGLELNVEYRSGIELEEKIYDVEKTEAHIDVIQNTEDLPRWKSWDKFLGSQQETARCLILDTELTPQKKYIPDTERIDYDSSSENEEKRHRDSDSDKTVSDLIEEPTTQDDVEPLKSAAILSWKSDVISYSPQKTISALSPKISEIISLNEPNSPQISIVDVSTETTPPRTQESSVPAAELLDSAKKKKSKPKKGSLGARLQKLISGQASSVRLWRHQMSRESGLERSSVLTLSVVDAWTQYGKNLYRSEVLNDPYNLLNGYISNEREESKEKRRSLVVMTNPDFVGSITLRAGSVFKIYPPWEIFRCKSDSDNLVLHSMYFNVVSNPVEVKLEPNDDQCGVEETSVEVTHSKVVRQFNCPCLQNGKIDASCLDKFTDHTVDIIAEMVK